MPHVVMVALDRTLVDAYLRRVSAPGYAVVEGAFGMVACLIATLAGTCAASGTGAAGAPHAGVSFRGRPAPAPRPGRVFSHAARSSSYQYGRCPIRPAGLGI